MKSPTLDPRLDQRLREAQDRFTDLDQSLSDPAVHSRPDKLRALGQERAHLEPVVAAGAQLRSALAEHRQTVLVVELCIMARTALSGARLG